VRPALRGQRRQTALRGDFKNLQSFEEGASWRRAGLRRKPELRMRVKIQPIVSEHGCPVHISGSFRADNSGRSRNSISRRVPSFRPPDPAERSNLPVRRGDADTPPRQELHHFRLRSLLACASLSLQGAHEPPGIFETINCRRRSRFKSNSGCGVNDFLGGSPVHIWSRAANGGAIKTVA